MLSMPSQLQVMTNGAQGVPQHTVPALHARCVLMLYACHAVLKTIMEVFYETATPATILQVDHLASAV